MSRRGHLHVGGDDSNLAKLPGGPGQRENSRAVDAVVIRDQDAHALAETSSVPVRNLQRLAGVRVLLIHNPNSGETDHEGERLVELVEREGHEVTYHSSKSEWPAGIDSTTDLIAVAGGDGTVSEVARMARTRGVPIAIIPTGTANNIATFLGVAGIPVEDLVASWGCPVFRPLDLGVATGPWGTFHFLESIGTGALAHLISEIDHGGASYVNSLEGRSPRIEAARELLRRTLSRSPAVRCEIRVDDRELSGDYLLVEALNFGAAGPNLKLAPHADGADGLLDVVVVRDDQRDSLERHLAARDAPSRTTLPALHARQVTLRCSPSMVHLDDELWSGESETADEMIVQASVEPTALSFLVPGHRDKR